MIERINFNINDILRIYRGKKIKFILSRINYYHNFTAHTNLKLSPFELIYNYNYLDPLKRDVSNKVYQNYKKFYEVQDKLKITKDPQIGINDLVLVKCHNPNDKLMFKYEGPFKVIRLLEKVNAVEIENSRVKRIESIRNLKKYHQGEESVVNTISFINMPLNKNNNNFIHSNKPSPAVTISEAPHLSSINHYRLKKALPQRLDIII